MAWVLVAIIAVLVLVVIGIYNRLVGLKQGVRQGVADIDAQLRQRHDLIPNLVETVKGYAAHESETFEAVIAARNAAASGAPSSGGEQQLKAALGNLLALGGGIEIKRAGKRQQIDMAHARALALRHADDVEHIVAFEREGGCIPGAVAFPGAQGGGGKRARRKQQEAAEQRRRGSGSGRTMRHGLALSARPRREVAGSPALLRVLQVMQAALSDGEACPPVASLRAIHK